MKTGKLFVSISVALGMIAGLPLSSQAQTKVSQIDADTLRVTEYGGKPPHKRLTIDQAEQPQLFAYYAERIDYDPQPVMLSERRGAPGKNTPRQVLRVTGDAAEIAEFARFEESEPNATQEARQWRGAPGKGRAFSR